MSLLAPLFSIINARLTGSSIFTNTDIIGAEKRAKLSGFSLASDLGVTSPNTSTSIVMTTVLIVTLASPKYCVHISVASEAEAILTMLLPTSNAISSSS